MNMWGAENIEQSIRHPSDKFRLTQDGVTGLVLHTGVQTPLLHDQQELLTWQATRQKILSQILRPLHESAGYAM